MTTMKKAARRASMARRHGKEALLEARGAVRELKRAVHGRKVSRKAVAVAATGLAVAALTTGLVVSRLRAR